LSRKRGWQGATQMTTQKSPRKRKGYWKTYERADIKDYRKVWKITKRIVQEEGIPFTLQEKGRNPNLPLWMYVGLAVLYVYFNDPFRETEKLLTLLTSKRLDHSNIIRWFSKLSAEYVDKLVYRVHLKIIAKSNDGDYLADSSGVTCDRYQETLFRGEILRELTHWKLHIFGQYIRDIGLVSIVSVTATHGDDHDGPVYRKHLIKAERVTEGKMCHADKAYFGKKNITKTEDAGLVANFVPKEMMYTDPLLKKAVFNYDNEARKQNRGLVETPFGGLETEMGMKIRCRKPEHRDIVVCLMGLKHNIKTHMRSEVVWLVISFAPTSEQL